MRRARTVRTVMTVLGSILPFVQIKSQHNWLGSAVRQDGRSASLTAPSGQAQQGLLRAALTDAGASSAATAAPGPADASSSSSSKPTGTAPSDRRAAATTLVSADACVVYSRTNAGAPQADPADAPMAAPMHVAAGDNSAAASASGPANSGDRSRRGNARLRSTPRSGGLSSKSDKRRRV